MKYRLTFTATLFHDDEAPLPVTRPDGRPSNGHEVVMQQLGELMADMGERYLIEVDTVAFDGWVGEG